jgi:hypothetical protein
MLAEDGVGAFPSWAGDYGEADDSDQVFDFCSPATHSTSHQPARLLQRSLRRADNGQVLTISIGQGALVGTAIGIGLGVALGLALMTRARHA